MKERTGEPSRKTTETRFTAEEDTLLLCARACVRPQLRETLTQPLLLRVYPFGTTTRPA